MNITPAGLQLLFQQIELNYQVGYQAAQTTYQEFCTVVPSKTRENHYGWLDKLPMVREWLGPRVMTNLVAQEYTLKNRKWELSAYVKREDVTDEVAAVFALGPQMMGMQTKVHPDVLAAQVLELGTSTLTFDTANFFSSSHPIDTANTGKKYANATTQSNYFTTATSGSMPLTAANVATGRQNMRLFVGRDAQPLGINPTHIMVHPAYEQQALQICNMTMIAPSGAFGINASGGFQENVLKGTLKPIINERLTSTTAWYLLDLSKGIKPLVFQDREPVEFTMMVNPNDPNVFQLDQYQYGSRARYNVGFALWFLAAKFDQV